MIPDSVFSKPVLKHLVPRDPTDITKSDVKKNKKKEKIVKKALKRKSVSCRGTPKKKVVESNFEPADCVQSAKDDSEPEPSLGNCGMLSDPGDLSSQDVD